MSAEPASRSRWSRAGAFVADVIGLNFPADRWADLQRGFARAAAELGFANAQECVDSFLEASPGPESLQILASHLTVGETYFFRERKVFDALGSEILPELIRTRQDTTRRLRIWSAGCCTGEEPYSVAILLRRLIPDIDTWHIDILATDINHHFLQKASVGSYGEWSFREAAPELRDLFFLKGPGGRYILLPEVRQMVHFAPLNLAEDAYPSLVSSTNAMDIILCRNVLMYFTPSRAARTVESLHHSLAAGGYLVASAVETSMPIFDAFEAVDYPGAILFRKGDTISPGGPSRRKSEARPDDDWYLHAVAVSAPLSQPVLAALPDGPREAPPAPAMTLSEAAGSLHRQGRYAESVDLLLALPPDEPRTYSLLARGLANLGRLDDALVWCDRWISRDKLDPAAHYVRAVVLLEQGRIEEALASLQRAVFLRPEFALAHFSLGVAARTQGRPDEARRHWRNVRLLLGELNPMAELEESDGLTAGRLTETVESLLALEAAA